MSELVAAQLAAMSLLEAVAVALAIAYLVLAIRESIWCWPCAFVSTALYIYLFGNVALYMESALNAFYLIMAVYGFMRWSRGAGESANVPVVVMSVRTHLAAAVIITILIMASALLLRTYTDQALPFADAFTSWTAVWATWLTARKVLENWWYWLVIDVVSAAMYFDRGLPLTGLLFIGYLIMIPFGFVAWRRSWRTSGEIRLGA
ncbi:MAG: nicotinamide riboside transporter PnuC [Pseudomonadota bacterium]